MIGEMPKFFESEYFVDEPGNWHLKPGAPKEVVDEFKKYMKNGADEPKLRKRYDHIVEEFP